LKSKAHISINKFIAGLFFIIWATNAYVLVGNLGKYLSLFTGLFLITTSVFKYNLFKKSTLFFFKTIVFFGLYVILAFILNQKTSEPILLVFGFINIILFIGGYLFSKQVLPNENLNVKLVFVMAILTIVGAIKLYIMQASLDIESQRDLGDETLNAVGVAYVYGQLFLLFFWLYNKDFSKRIKFLFLITLVAIVIVLLITESRGAVLFLLLTLVWFYKQKIRSYLRLKNILLILIVGGGLLFVFRTNKIIESKIDVVTNRFETAFKHASGNSRVEDGSLEERADIQSEFFEHYDKMFLGYEGYEPYPHNQYIEIYMRWGFFGIPLLLVSLISFKRAIGFVKNRNYSENSTQYLLVAIFFFCYLQSMSSLSLEMNRTMWFGFGLLISNSLKRK
jgi:O-antigen ligase